MLSKVSHRPVNQSSLWRRRYRWPPPPCLVSRRKDEWGRRNLSLAISGLWQPLKDMCSPPLLLERWREELRWKTKVNLSKALKGLWVSHIGDHFPLSPPPPLFFFFLLPFFLNLSRSLFSPLHLPADFPLGCWRARHIDSLSSWGQPFASRFHHLIQWRL